MKTCNWCSQDKPVSDYHSDIRTQDGLRATCKQCTNERNQKNRKRTDSPRLTQEYIENNAESVACCKTCGGLFNTARGRAHLSKYCSDKCRYEGGYLNKDGVEKKAIVMGANLLMGKGKKAYLMELVGDAVGEICPYCDETLTLDNMNLDHKQAYADTKTRRNKAENREIRQVMDRPENLHVVCKDCNQIKSDIDHVDFVELLEFLENREKMKVSLFKRLKRASAPFGRRR